MSYYDNLFHAPDRPKATLDTLIKLAEAAPSPTDAARRDMISGIRTVAEDPTP